VCRPKHAQGVADVQAEVEVEGDDPVGKQHEKGLEKFDVALLSTDNEGFVHLAGKDHAAEADKMAPHLELRGREHTVEEALRVRQHKCHHRCGLARRLEEGLGHCDMRRASWDAAVDCMQSFSQGRVELALVWKQAVQRGA
jgi:hypothetical protein